MYVHTHTNAYIHKLFLCVIIDDHEVIHTTVYEVHEELHNSFIPRTAYENPESVNISPIIMYLKA